VGCVGGVLHYNNCPIVDVGYEGGKGGAEPVEASSEVVVEDGSKAVTQAASEAGVFGYGDGAFAERVREFGGGFHKALLEQLHVAV